MDDWVTPGDDWVTPSPSSSDIAADVAKSGASGVAKGVVGIPGIPGSLAGLIHTAGNPLVASALERIYGPEVANRFRDVSSKSQNPLPTSQEVTDAAGLTYQPKTTAGKYAETVGEFAPNVIGGPEALATRVLTRAAIPGAASEAAGQATEGTAYEPYARIAAALASGGTAARATRPGPLAAPTVEEVKNAARAGYQSPEVAAVQIKPSAVSSLGDKIENDLIGAGFRQGTTPKTFSIVNELDVPQGVQSVGVADLDSVRKALGVMSKERDIAGAPTAEAAAASRAIGHIDDFLPNLRPADLLAGDANQANAILAAARGNWKSAKQAELAATKMENARVQAASTYGGGNINNALRQAYRPLEVNNYAKTANWSPEAKAALQDVVEGALFRNSMRDIGRLAPTGPVNVGMHLAAGLPIAGMTGGVSIPLQLGIGAGTYAAKKIGEFGTQRAAQRLINTLLRESPLHQQRLQSFSPATRLSPLLRGGLLSYLAART